MGEGSNANQTPKQAGRKERSGGTGMTDVDSVDHMDRGWTVPGKAEDSRTRTTGIKKPKREPGLFI